MILISFSLSVLFLNTIHVTEENILFSITICHPCYQMSSLYPNVTPVTNDIPVTNVTPVTSYFCSMYQPTNMLLLHLFVNLNVDVCRYIL